MVKTVESFEGLTTTDNSPRWSFLSGYFVPGALSVYEFESGARLIAPIPNPNNFEGGTAVVADFAVDNENTWGVGDVHPADVNSPAVVPHGTAYMARFVEVNGTLTFGFNKDVFQAGAYVNAATKIGVAAYDASGKLISGARVNYVPAADWDTNFLQVISKKPIAKIEFTGQFMVLDELTFDTDKPNVVKGTKFKDKIGSASAKAPSDIADLILGKGGNDKLFGQGGDDHIDGGKGKDKLYGGAGNDTLVGGRDKDKLWGGEGQDSFLFDRLNSFDVVKDFNVNDDSILLARSAFTGLGLGTPSSAQFDASASSADVRIIYEAGSGKLLYDSDGNGPNQAVQFAKLAPGLALTAEHFFVV